MLEEARFEEVRGLDDDDADDARREEVKWEVDREGRGEARWEMAGEELEEEGELDEDDEDTEKGCWWW